uniref:Uncharacterized protein n=1 Tax=Heterosigma akashiwo TaxID=2829 RepID=A0A7S3UPB8_HETAK
MAARHLSVQSAMRYADSALGLLDRAIKNKDPYTVWPDWKSPLINNIDSSAGVSDRTLDFLPKEDVCAEADYLHYYTHEFFLSATGYSTDTADMGNLCKNHMARVVGRAVRWTRTLTLEDELETALCSKVLPGPAAELRTLMAAVIDKKVREALERAGLHQDEEMREAYIGGEMPRPESRRKRDREDDDHHEKEDIPGRQAVGKIVPLAGKLRALLDLDIFSYEPSTLTDNCQNFCRRVKPLLLCLEQHHNNDVDAFVAAWGTRLKKPMKNYKTTACDVLTSDGQCGAFC